MKTTLLLLFFLMIPALSRAEEILYSNLLKGETSVGTVVKDPVYGEILELSNDSDSIQTIELLTLEEPGIKSPIYALRGMVRYNTGNDQGYLELWSHFADGSAYFTRTLASRGPLASLIGESSWRPFVMPFRVKTENELTAPTFPVRLQFNMIIPRGGRVSLAGLQLSQFHSNENPLALAGQWWGEREAGVLGGIAGTLLGLLGATAGILAGKGKARRFVLSITVLTAGIGLLLLAAGVYAQHSSQPYVVFYPLLLGGAICTLVFGPIYFVLRTRYTQSELRKMTALD